jgi:8-oxo-dGTP pyrophosphatase MutT (NUDIX family)
VSEARASGSPARSTPAGTTPGRDGRTAPEPAATVVLLRPSTSGQGGFEVLLTRRPDSMRFGPGMHVFPGGRLEPGEAALDAALRETAEETGIELDPTALTPFSRWVTPFGLPRRFDARFFTAVVPAGTDVSSASDEVAAWAWLQPVDALEGMAAGRLAMWQPTVVTLQQLEPARDEAGLQRLLETPSAVPGADGDGSDGGAAFRSIRTSWAAGIEGRWGETCLVGDRSWLVVNPGDPTDETVIAALAAADAAGAALAGVVIEDLTPEHHAGVEMFARGLGLPVAGPPGADHLAPYPIEELGPRSSVPFGDASLTVELVTPPRGASPLQAWADRAGRIRLRD